MRVSQTVQLVAGKVYLQAQVGYDDCLQGCGVAWAGEGGGSNISEQLPTEVS
jgi:hypothetical protein